MDVRADLGVGEFLPRKRLGLLETGGDKARREAQEIAYRMNREYEAKIKEARDRKKLAAAGLGPQSTFSRMAELFPSVAKMVPAVTELALQPATLTAARAEVGLPRLAKPAPIVRPKVGLPTLRECAADFLARQPALVKNSERTQTRVDEMTDRLDSFISNFMGDYAINECGQTAWENYQKHRGHGPAQQRKDVQIGRQVLQHARDDASRVRDPDAEIAQRDR